MSTFGKWPLLVIGGLAILYCVAVLVFVATSPDLRLRCLLVDDGPSRGIEIYATPHWDDDELNYKGPRPEPGDVLLEVREQPTHTFLDFTAQLMALRNAKIEGGGKVHQGTDMSEYTGLPPLVEEENTNRRWVRIAFANADTGEVNDNTWLLVQSVPLDEVVLTVVWFFLELGIFLVGALAYWNRPFERASRLFFVMCIVTLGAFVGGYHWWVIAGSLLLNVPFVVCAVLVPAVTLHFFLAYPRAKAPLSRWPRLTLTGIYAAPALAILGFLTVEAYCRWLHGGPSAEQYTPLIRDGLQLLKAGIYSYLIVAGLYFVAILAALGASVATTRNSLEHSQVTWILWAALIAVIPVGYTLYLACFDRVGFALGAARLPMFLASLCFMLAYAVGIIRYRLLLAEQFVSRGMMYYAFSFGLTIVFATVVASSGVVPQLLNISLSPKQSAVVLALLAVSVILLLWIRDRLQQMIDLQFFREKYQLDKAMERVNRAIGHLVEPTSLGEAMLGSCRDVLRVDHAAVYLRNSARGPFELVAEYGAAQLPVQCTATEPLTQALREKNCWQRATVGTRQEHSPVQILMRGLDAEVIHVLELEGVVAGYIALGRKTNGTPFTAEDLTFVNALRQMTSIALHSAKVHQDMTRLNEEMRLKVDKIQTQQRQIAMLESELADRLQPAKPRADRLDGLRRDAIHGDSPAIRGVLETVRKVAGSESTVMIRGESGTGKELLAQVLHDNSARRGAEMVRVHCAALSPTLLESELFGHVKGAFTGAHQDKIGRFEAANGGTLFLDEIGDISLETQIKLLRVLQERCFEPVGGTRTVHVDVRLMTATHQNLEKLIADGRFREDLYYRLNVISITLPPLRERKEDLMELAMHFLRRASDRLGKSISHFDEDAWTALERHDWPGNIRELQNVVERAVVLAEGKWITLGDLPAELASPAAAPARLIAETKPLGNRRVHAAAQHMSAAGLRTSTARSERELLVTALEECEGNKAEAARRLGMPRSTLVSKLQKYSLM